MTEQPNNGQGADPEATRIVSIDGLAAKVDGLAAKLEQLLSGAHGAAQKHEERKLNEPSDAAGKAEDVAGQVRQAIADHDRQQKAEERAGALERQVGDLAGKLEQLGQRAPREIRRVETIMRWRRDDDQ